MTMNLSCGLPISIYKVIPSRNDINEQCLLFLWFESQLLHLKCVVAVCRYFFAEVFNFFRIFFLIVFHVNILFMLLPLAIRLNHRPFFLAFVYVAISSMLKSYPSVSCPFTFCLKNLYFCTGSHFIIHPLLTENSIYPLRHDRFIFLNSALQYLHGIQMNLTADQQKLC